LAAAQNAAFGVRKSGNQFQAKEGREMKKFLVLALLAAFVLSAAVASAATTLKTSGQMDFAYGWTDNTNFFSTDNDKQNEDDLMAMQRFRSWFDWSASESLRGVFGIEFGTAIWGLTGAGYGSGTDLDGDERAIEVKHAYMDFTVPNTGVMVRMGLQPIALPSNFGSPIFDYDVPGILAQYKFNDMFSAAFAWMRLANQNAGTANAISNIKGAKNDEVDAFALMLPIKGNGFEFTPWGAYAIHGANATAAGTGGPLAGGLVATNASAPIAESVDVWWAGGSLKLTMFAPFEIMADLIYGSSDGSNNSQNDREGWFFDLGVNYKMDNVTPGVFFMYSTGDDDDPANGSERIPTVGANVFFTSFGFAGASGLLDEGPGFADRELSSDGTEGMWVLGAQLADFSFVDKLTHVVRVAYGKGTCDSDIVKNKGVVEALTDKDSFWEVNFDSTYSIYENLTAYVEMGWIDLNLDDSVWNSKYGRSTGVYAGSADKTSNAWKLAVNLTYKF
jgi:opacity protein-like surface antigen